MDSNSEEADRASRGRRIFDALLRTRPEDTLDADEASESSVSTMDEEEQTSAEPVPPPPASMPEAASEAHVSDAAPSAVPEDPAPPAPTTTDSVDSQGDETSTLPPRTEDDPSRPPLPGVADLGARIGDIEGREQPALTPTADEGERVVEEAEAVPSSAPDPDPGEPPLDKLALPRVIAIANQKGGVGKTTTSVNLGAALAELGFRVLIVDLDPQGNATTGVGIDISNLAGTLYESLMNDSPLEDCVEPTSVRNLFIAPSNMALAGAEIELVPMFSRELKLRRAVEGVKSDYDFVLIDCPPSLGLLTVNGLAAADDVIVPIQCEYYALEGVGQLVNNVGLVRANLNPVLDIRGIVLTMHDARTKLADQVVEEVRAHFGNKVFKTVVPRTVRLSEAPSFGQPIIVFDPSSRGADAYRGLAVELADRVEPGPGSSGHPQEVTGSPTG